jgi:NADP-dependent 3-hydroxy acid dehydrogenase YdfG
VRTAIDRFGGLDVFFANAGFGAKRGFLEEAVEHWKAMIDTNVLGAALSIRAALSQFRAQGKGHMLLTSSVAGRRTMPGSLYSATKHAVTAMGESLRAEVADSDIKVTLIEPGMVDTPFFDQKPDAALESDDIARAVMFALTQPGHVDVNEILIRPIRQAG